MTVRNIDITLSYKIASSKFLKLWKLTQKSAYSAKISVQLIAGAKKIQAIFGWSRHISFIDTPYEFVLDISTSKQKTKISSPTFDSIKSCKGHLHIQTLSTSVLQLVGNLFWNIFQDSYRTISWNLGHIIETLLKTYEDTQILNQIEDKNESHQCKHNNNYKNALFEFRKLATKVRWEEKNLPKSCIFRWDIASTHRRNRKKSGYIQLISSNQRRQTITWTWPTFEHLNI